jgi:hypothetical protein
MNCPPHGLRNGNKRTQLSGVRQKEKLKLSMNESERNILFCQENSIKY